MDVVVPMARMSPLLEITCQYRTRATGGAIIPSYDLSSRARNAYPKKVSIGPTKVDDAFPVKTISDTVAASEWKSYILNI
jgi:hypothetical protein